MTQLGTMMLRAGLLSEQQLSHVQILSGDRDIPFLDALLELGLSSEDAVCAFFHSKLLIPRVDSYLLERLDTRPLKFIPAQVARRHTVLPVSIDDVGNLTLAMADPTDVQAVEAATEHAGAYLVRAVAPLGPLRRAVDRYYGEDPGATQPGLPIASVVEGVTPQWEEPSAPGDDTSFADDDLPSPEDSFPGQPIPAQAIAGEPGTVEPVAPQSDQPQQVEVAAAEPVAVGPPAPPARDMEPEPPPPTSAPAEAPPIELTEVHSAEPGAPIELTEVHSQPGTREPPPADTPPPRRERSRTPSGGMATPLLGIDSEPPPLSSEAFGRLLPRLVATRDRDEVTSALVDFLAAGFQRVILFVHLRGELRGHDARGSDLMLEAIRQVRIPSDGESVFSRVIGQKIPYFGPMPRQSTIDIAFSDALGGVMGNVLVLPVSLAGKVPILLFASGTSYPVDPRSLRELTEASSHALSRLIVAKRSRKE